MRRQTMKELSEEALRAAREAQADAKRCAREAERSLAAVHAILDRLVNFVKWAAAYGHDADDPFQRRAIELVRGLQDDALKGVVEEKGKTAP